MIESYLNFSNEEIPSLNSKGLGKLLFIRRESIYIKNIMRQATANRKVTEQLFTILGIGWPDYLRFLSKRLRRILKAPRTIPEFQLHEHIKSRLMQHSFLCDGIHFRSCVSLILIEP